VGGVLLTLPIHGPLVTIVVPAYNEASRLRRLYRRIHTALIGVPCRWEVVLVDDGSEDGTARAWRELMAHDARLGLVELCRNFGKEPALLAGFTHARGDVVVPMDADLQDPPEVIARFLLRWREGFDIVYGVRLDRDDPCWKRVCAWLFYQLLNRLARLEIPAHAGDFRLLDRRVVDRLCALPEVDRFTRGLYHWVGGRTCAVPYHRPARSGAHRYRFAQSLDQAVSALSFCATPVRGVCLLGVALLLGGVVLTLAQLHASAATSLAQLLWAHGLLSCALPVCSCGLLGLYLEGVLREVKQRPSYLVARASGAVRHGAQEETAARSRERRGGARAAVVVAPRGAATVLALDAPLALPPAPLVRVALEAPGPRRGRAQPLGAAPRMAARVAPALAPPT
jgi:hypothetical protein